MDTILNLEDAPPEDRVHMLKTSLEALRKNPEHVQGGLQKDLAQVPYLITVLNNSSLPAKEKLRIIKEMRSGLDKVDAQMREQEEHRLKLESHRTRPWGEQPPWVTVSSKPPSPAKTWCCCLLTRHGCWWLMKLNIMGLCFFLFIYGVYLYITWR
jgi:hypothetical protein